MIKEGISNKAILLKIKNAPENARNAVAVGFHRLGKLQVVHTRKLIRKGPKTGRWYRIKGRKRRHRASAPGQAPANLKGNLARSINYKIRGNEMAFGTKGVERGPQVQAGGGVSYGAWLDGGTKKIAPRPHLSRTAKQFESTSESIFNGEIYNAIK